MIDDKQHPVARFAYFWSIGSVIGNIIIAMYFDNRNSSKYLMHVVVWMVVAAFIRIIYGKKNEDSSN